MLQKKIFNPMNLIRILSVFLCFCLFDSVYCKSVLDIIDKEHSERCKKFDLNREDESLVSYTTKIADIFSDPHKINYKKSATEEDKKRALKAIMGNIIIHDASLDSLYNLKTFNNSLYGNLYQRQIDAINTIDTAVRVLWGKFKKSKSHRLEDILNSKKLNQFKTGKFDCKKLLTSHFIEWFYESLEEHLPEKKLFQRQGYA